MIYVKIVLTCSIISIMTRNLKTFFHLEMKTLITIYKLNLNGRMGEKEIGDGD